MSKPLNTNFTLNAPKPLDSRTQVPTYANLAFIPVVYIGLKTYVVDEDKEYRYKSTGWTPVEEGSGGGAISAAWGSITGTLTDQTDLVSELNLKFNKAGGVISGATIVEDTVTAYNMVIYGSEPSVEFPYMQSSLEGEPAGSSLVLNTVFISQVDYDAAVAGNNLVLGTNYIIT